MGGGGAERQLAYLAGPMGALGWDVHVALLRGGPNLARLEGGGAIVHRLAGWTNHDPRLPLQLARVVRRVRPDLLQVWFVQMEVFGGLVAEAFGVPWILSERSSAPAYPPTWRNRLRVRMGKTADAIVANCAAGDAYWSEHGDPRVPRDVIPNAVPFDEIAAAEPAMPAHLQVSDRDTVVLFAGRFDAAKNIDRLIEALARAVRRRDTVAVLCGDGPERPRIERLIEARGLADRVRLAGYVTDIWPLLKRARAMVAVSVFEGRPNSVLEAMAAGCPLVVSDIPAHREVLTEASALWANPMDVDSIARAVTAALDDPAAARARAALARERAAEWSIGGAAAAYDGVYRRVLAHRGALEPVQA